MDWKRQCAAVVPCFNEAAHIGSVIAGVQKHLPKIIVVDDGSTDATTEKAKTAGAEVLRRPTNCGKGAALSAGWRRARELGFTWALMLDGDGQHAPDDIPNFFDRAEKNWAPLIVGHRMDNSDAMPWLRRIANRWMSERLSRLTGVRLPDSQCGFRLAHLETLLRLPLRANRFEIESEMLVAFLAAKQKVAFVPTQVIYKSNTSRINPLTDTWRWLRWRLAQRNVFRACSTMRVP
ncbi:MAG: glycosyltransferase family 2 protein [Verrucomicrobiota bacterium]